LSFFFRGKTSRLSFLSSLPPSLFLAIFMMETWRRLERLEECWNPFFGFPFLFFQLARSIVEPSLGFFFPDSRILLDFVISLK